MSGCTEAHLNPMGADNKSVKVTLVCASLLCYGHLDGESCASDPTAPQVPHNHPVTDNCIAAQMLAETQVHWQGLVSGALSSLGSCAPAVGLVLAVAPLASLGTACWAVIVPAVLNYLLPCTGLHPISLLQHPELSVGAIQSIAT